jgi:hypothetical protein
LGGFFKGLTPKILVVMYNDWLEKKK